jgi:hypothetical protein
MKRRHMLGLTAAALAFPGRVWAAPSPYALLAAGPVAELISRWAAACAMALGPGFPGNPVLQVQPTGGLDGVTGANKFDALVVPDGATAAIFPGATLIAWLTGDSRVHFDPTHWVPVMAASNSGVLVVRQNPGVRPTPQTIQPGGSLKLAVDQPQSNDLAALLALQRMGVQTSPIFGLRDTDARTRAFLAGEADAVFLSGEGVPEDIAPLSANGGVPVFSLGSMGDDGQLTRDPLFPTLPDADSFGQVDKTAPYAAAYASAAAAARLDFLVTLPHLTDPGAEALWRQAALTAIGTSALDSAADASSVRLRSAAATAAELNALALSPTDQLGLQNFLQTRFGWRASANTLAPSWPGSARTPS